MIGCNGFPAAATARHRASRGGQRQSHAGRTTDADERKPREPERGRESRGMQVNSRAGWRGTGRRGGDRLGHRLPADSARCPGRAIRETRTKAARSSLAASAWRSRRYRSSRKSSSFMPRRQRHSQLAEVDVGASRQASNQCWRSSIIFLISAMALAGLRSFGQASVQFMMVWQRYRRNGSSSSSSRSPVASSRESMIQR